MPSEEGVIRSVVRGACLTARPSLDDPDGRIAYDLRRLDDQRAWDVAYWDERAPEHEPHP